MVFNSISFAFFFPISVLLYYAVPKSFRRGWLLIVSYIFYLFQGPAPWMLLVAATLLSFMAGLLLEKNSADTRRKKLVLLASVLVFLAVLFTFKYFGFFMGILGYSAPFSLLLPVGISFYLFQIMGYLIDVYRGDVAAEHNILDYALFVSFFPQILSGPIGRAGKLLPQLKALPDADYERIRLGLFRMLWGYFLKLVIASRLTIVVDLIFQNYMDLNGWYLIIGALAFSIQIYCDFASYSILAVGAAEVLGIKLTENFRQPFFALTLDEIWRRWHISLMSWFKDYVYIPLGGSRKGIFRKYLNIIIVFTLSGLWHGADWTYVVWGFLSGFLQVVGSITRPFRARMFSLMPFKGRWFGRLHRIWQRVATLCLFTFTAVFFNAESLAVATGYLSRMVRHLSFNELLSTSPFILGLGHLNLFLAIFALAVLLCVDIIRERKGDAAVWFLKKKWYIRWGAYYFLVIFILLSANIGAARFIYFQF